MSDSESVPVPEPPENQASTSRNSFGFPDNEENENPCNYYNLIDQFAQDVASFSSQYGSDNTISYTALNITGRPSKYPNYGDFPETFAMRTYGKWWDMAPSRLSPINSQSTHENPSLDFVVVRFEQSVIPQKISLYETYNPGALIRIWTLSPYDRWVCLWEGPPQICEQKSRIFEPELKKIDYPIKTIRLEFNHRHLNYFTEIDGITLRGKKCMYCPKLNPSPSTSSTVCQWKGQDEKNTFQDLVDESNRSIQQNSNLSDDDDKKQLSLIDMPFDVLYQVFSFLDIKSLFRVGGVCKKFREISLQPLLYSEVSLKPFWHITTEDTMTTITQRGRHIKKLDLSWCGFHIKLTPTVFDEFDVRRLLIHLISSNNGTLLSNMLLLCTVRFLHQRGKSLTHLRLNSCRFLSACCVENIGINCDNLKELCLQNYCTDRPPYFYKGLTKLRNLERLDISRTYFSQKLLLAILSNNLNLKHLNLSSCGQNLRMDEIALYLSMYNKNLISVDMWKTNSLTSEGLKALAECHQLEEVELGWCLREDPSPGEGLMAMIRGCPNLKKLFLAAIRGITDRELECIANNCPNLEQLDLMSILGISSEKCYEILCKCPKLKLLDLCFTTNLDESQISSWRSKFNVDIKRGSSVPSKFLS